MTVVIPYPENITQDTESLPIIGKDADMKKFWENYKRNLRLLMRLGRRYWKAFAVICFASSFIVTAVNFVLSFYIVNPKYFLGDGHFIPDGIKAILVVILIHFMFAKYIKYKHQKKNALSD